MITKLVRDKIPALFEASGQNYWRLDHSQDKGLYWIALANKVQEEAAEVAAELKRLDCGSDYDTTLLIGELADLLEIIQAVRDEFEIDDYLEFVQKEKFEEKGGFESRSVITY